MSRNDVVMTPLRVKQAIDSRFFKPSEDELNVFIGGTWVEFVKKVELPPPVNCAELLTMYRNDETLTETPVINATGCTSLHEVFFRCRNLITVNYIHTPNVTDMSGMFVNCESLTSVPAMDTSNVTNMGSMFQYCSSLTSIPEMDTSNVTDMNAMFNGCSSLTTTPKLDMSNVTNTDHMFTGCSSLTSVTLTGNVVAPYGRYIFLNTPIASGNGNIFVPVELVDAYKTAEGWSLYVDVIKGISEWYDTLGFTEFLESEYGLAVETNKVQYTEQEMLDLLPIHVKWNGTFTDVETGEAINPNAVIVRVIFNDKKINLNSPSYEINIGSVDLPNLSEDEFYTFSLRVALRTGQGVSKFHADGYFEIRESNANGTLLGHYPLHHTIGEPACYLTTAMVGYYGKADDGVELTAMRQLREVYAKKHAETLKTYYSDSAIIVSEIKRLGMQEHYYGRIKDVVDEIVTHVENENWSAAEVLYLDLYYGLKEELEMK